MKFLPAQAAKNHPWAWTSTILDQKSFGQIAAEFRDL